MKSMLIIGLGNFGEHLALKFTELGNEVMVVDKCEEVVNKIAPYVNYSQIGDCMDIGVLRSLGVGNFDVCFVCIGKNFQSSLEITSLLKDLNAQMVISQTDTEIQAKFLLKIGADDVIFPERDCANRTAVKYSNKNAIEYMELTTDYAIFEMLVKDDWIGKSIKKLALRTKYNINVIGIKKNGQVLPVTDPEYIFSKDEHLLVAGDKKGILNLVDKI